MIYNNRPILLDIELSIYFQGSPIKQQFRQSSYNFKSFYNTRESFRTQYWKALSIK